MKEIPMNRRTFVALSLTFFGLVSHVHAADLNPTGTWKWSVTNPNNNQTREQSLTLKLEGDKLTGTVPGPKSSEIKIEDATFKDGQISFSVTRERNDQKIKTKFTGKLEGDTIKGKSESERDGQTQSRDWEAKR